MSAKLVKKIVELLKEMYDFPDMTDDQWKEDASSVLGLIEEEQAAEKKAVVVGQVLYTGAQAPVTVALGPFGQRAVKAAQDAAGKLVYNPMQKTVQGRYMIVPLYKSPQLVFNEFGKGLVSEEQAERLVHDMADATWHISDTPACMCGLRSATHCYRHNKDL